MAQAVSRRPPTAEAWDRFRVISLGLVVDRVALAFLFFSEYFVSVIPPMLHTYLNLHVCLGGRTNGQGLGTFQKAVFL